MALLLTDIKTMLDYLTQHKSKNNQKTINSLFTLYHQWQEEKIDRLDSRMELLVLKIFPTDWINSEFYKINALKTRSNPRTHDQAAWLNQLSSLITPNCSQESYDSFKKNDLDSFKANDFGEFGNILERSGLFQWFKENYANHFFYTYPLLFYPTVLRGLIVNVNERDKKGRAKTFTRPELVRLFNNFRGKQQFDVLIYQFLKYHYSITLLPTTHLSSTNVRLFKQTISVSFRDALMKLIINYFNSLSLSCEDIDSQLSTARLDQFMTETVRAMGTSLTDGPVKIIYHSNLKNYVQQNDQDIQHYIRQLFSSFVIENLLVRRIAADINTNNLVALNNNEWANFTQALTQNKMTQKQFDLFFSRQQFLDQLTQVNPQLTMILFPDDRDAATFKQGNLNRLAKEALKPLMNLIKAERQAAKEPPLKKPRVGDFFQATSEQETGQNKTNSLMLNSASY